MFLKSLNNSNEQQSNVSIFANKGKVEGKKNSSLQWYYSVSK